MSFRRNRDEWSEIVRRHRVELLECGIPEPVFADHVRFLVFLDHGYDEIGWLKSKHEFFDAKILTDTQLTSLTRFVSAHVGEREAKVVALRWSADPDHPAIQKNQNSN